MNAPVKIKNTISSERCEYAHIKIRIGIGSFTVYINDKLKIKHSEFNFCDKRHAIPFQMCHGPKRKSKTFLK